MLFGVQPANPKFRTLSFNIKRESNFGTENNVDELNLKRQQGTLSRPEAIIKRRISNTSYLTYRPYSKHINLLGEYVFDQRTIINLDPFRSRNSS